MARELWCNDAEEAFDSIRWLLVQDGESVAPRGQTTLEARNVTITVADPTHPLIRRPKMSSQLAALEALQLIGGFSDAALMARCAPNTARFQDGGYFHGAYGPRLRAQLPKIVDRLMADPLTRQAVAVIWDPAQDLHLEGLHDYPCTVYLSWVLRNGKLEQTTHMRSNDLWWGWTYDVVQFTQLQCTLANVLRADVGPYVHVVDSMHLYHHDLVDIQSTDLPGAEYPPQFLDGLTGDDWAFASSRARWLAQEPETFTPVNESESWFHEQMLALDGK